MTVSNESGGVLSRSEKQEMLRRILLEKVSRPRTAPVSLAQERLLFLDRLQPGNPAYNIPAALRLSGPLNVPALERALGEIVRRHESLRTVFATDDGVPVQVIAPLSGFTLPLEDLSAAGDPEAAARLRAAAEADRPFDLAAGPLFRATLMRLGPDEHLLLMCMHHVVSDGWSLGVLHAELAALYGAYSQGRESPLPELPAQYAGFAAWQRDHLRGEALERLLAYWRQRLAGTPELLELPTDRPRPPVQSFRGGHAEAHLPAGLVERLERLGQGEGATLYMVLLAAFQALLSKYAGREDVVVGCPVAGRTRDEVEGLIGFFVNLLVLRTDLSGDPGFRALLRRVREVTLGAYEHQEVPFDRLVEELRPERSLGHPALAQVVLMLQERGAPPPALPGLRVEAAEVEEDLPKFDLVLNFAPAEGGLRGVLQYAADLFDPETGARMLRHLVRILEQAAADPDRPLSALELPDADERRRVLEEWNGPRASYPADEPLHRRFQARAAAAPDAVAAVCEGASLTYGELNARANRLAHHLRRHGVGPEVRVGLCLERGLEMVVSILAVLKAGGAYVPLDPAYPAERLRFMLDDSGAAVLVTEARLRDALPAESAAAVVRVDGQAAEIAAESSADPEGGAGAEHLAYVIYTSGSTGTPKGVGVTHANVLRLFASTESGFGFSQADVWTLFHSYAFDFSVWEIWGALLYGGRLVVVPWADSRDPASFRALLARERVTVLSQTPSAFRALAAADADHPDPLRHLRVVVFGGEALRYESLRGWLDRYGPRRPRLVNMYGITETTVHVTWHTVTGRELREAETGSGVGVPIPDLRAYVLDPAGNPSPVGVPGELHVGGAGLARGYLGRPGLTAQRFVPDPFSGDAGARLYRSGDRARWKADGTLEYRGRIDQQVKVRGFRIEPGEIEAALLAHPAVSAAAVVVRGEGDDAALAAYFVPAGEAPSASALRDALKKQLPEHMVPGAFVPLDRIPLTVNGKLDRAALPAPQPGAGEGEGFAAPRTPVEELLASVWCDVLKVERVGAHDDFFDLGGHSLLATRVVTRVREVLGAELPLRVMFESPTVAGVARAVEEIRRADAPRLPAVVPVDRDGPLPLSFAQERLWFLDRLEPDSPLYNMPLAVRLAGALDAAALERALGEVLRRHESLRTVFAERDGVPVQVVAPFAGFALAAEDLSGVDGAAREATVLRRADENARRPFDLAAGPLFRAALLRLAAEEHVLLLCVHHVVSDGWSTGVLFRELSALYAAFREGAEASLPPLPVQYADFAAWQRRHLRGEALARQLAWWTERLAGAPELLELPTDRPRPPVQTYRGGSEPFALSAALVERLEALGRREGATLYMVLLGAFQVLLSKYAGSDDVSVGSPVAGRTRAEVEGLIGFFVNTLVLRTDLSGDPSFRALLGRVREVTLGAWEHQDVPFEKLVAELRPERSLGHAPLFQVFFSLETAEGVPLPTLAGVRVAEVEAHTGTTKFDLSLQFAPDDAGTGGLAGALGYATDLFDPGTVRRMLEHLLRVLEQAAEDPDRALSALELPGEAERSTVVEAWNRTDAAYPADEPLHRRFQARAAAAPDAVAAVCEGASLTYGELNARANRLAHHLRRHGVGPEVRVGLCLERGLEMVVSILAVLKAGGAYVPLDPAYPAERLRFMLEDCGAAVLVTQQALLGALPSAPGVVRVSVDGDAAEIAAESSDDPAGGAGAEHLAYVIYTSGSTGTPKGVLIEHRNVARLFTATEAWFGFGAEDVWTLFHSYAFDFSVWELWGALLYGGRVVVVPFGVSRDPEAFHALLARERVTVLSQTPSAFRQLMRADAERGGELALRLVVFGGEALEPASLREWVRRRGADAPRLVNMYGITETTVHVTYRPLAEADVFGGTGSPIGVRIPDLRLYVLGEGMRPLPVGVPGELYVGGAGVARGYLNRPELTAARFVENPFAEGRLYRTGDRVRWRADGTLEYLGRIDQQVKIRGFRIELGEIEAALLDHPAVRECAAVVREDAPGEKRLVAYLVGQAEPDALRAHLRRTLPEYMVPAAFVALDRLPLTPNGKLDVRALPAPGSALPAERYEAPRTPAEETLAAVWGEVLRLERVGVRDNFFEAGGDSILSIQVVSRARRAGVEITPRQLFEYQTIAELAAVAGTRGGAAARGAEREPAGREVPLTPIQARFFAAEHPAPWHYNQGVPLAVDPALPDETLEAALDAVLAHHDALRLRFRRTEAGWAQRHADAHGIALERVDLSALPADARDAAQDEAARARQAGLRLEDGPLGRAVLFDRGEEGRVLLLVFHHLVVDGVSWRILREDLERASGQRERGEPIDLGARSTSFAAWAEALRTYARSERLRTEAAWWLAQGPEGVAPLPADGARDAAAGETRTVTVRLEEDETRALLQEAPAAYRTQVNDVLLCALAQALGGWAGGSRIRVALEGHGREEEVGDGVDLTRTVGWFTSVYPVVLDLAGAAGPGERLRAVKEQLRAVPRRGVGYGVLRYLGPDEVRGALAAQPEPEVSFNYLGQFDAGLALASRFRFADGPRGRDVAEENRADSLLHVNGTVEAGRLRLDWTYAGAALRAGTVERVAESYLHALRALVAHCREAGAGGCTPSDFPLAGVAQAELDAAVGARRDVEDLYPLSPMQEGMLFHSLYGGASQAYQVQVAYRLEGALDAERFRRAWDAVVARHPVLRTAFVWRGLRRPLQRVVSAVRLPWRAEDWRALGEAEQDAALTRYLAEDRARGYALDEAPLLRCALFRAGERAHWFVLSQHHLLMDRWSSTRVLGEVFRLYRAWTTGGTAELPRARPYRDYIGWLARRDPDAAERWWTGVLAGFTAPTPLAVDRPAGADAGARYGRRTVLLTPERTRRLEEAARARQVTLNTLLLGAWSLLLSRYSGHGDVVFGNVVAGRPAELEGVEEMVGLFINTLPVRVRLPGGARTGAWLAELQRTQAEAREHEHAPLVQVQGWSEVPRGTPLFESLLIFNNVSGDDGAASAADAPLRIGDERAVEWTTYPLTLSAAPGDELVLSLAWDESRFDAPAMERMLEHLGRALDGLAGDPDAPLAALDLAGDAERRLVVEEWNRTGAAYSADACIHQLFERQAARTPDAVAVTFGGASLTYAALDARANRIANHLRGMGVGPEVRVGLCVERGLGLMPAILGVMKAGGAYVPVDPAHPAERIGYVMADAAVSVLLTQQALRPRVPVAPSVRVVTLDGDGARIAAERAEAPESGVTSENLAYVIYTSGSTGRPKGVAMHHRGVVNYIEWGIRHYGADAGTGAPVFSSMAVDLTITNLLPLFAGHPVHFLPEENPVEALAEVLRRRPRFGMIKITPVHLGLLTPLLTEDEARGAAKTLVIGADFLSAETTVFWQDRAPGVRLMNEYGPTETVVGCSAYTLPSGVHRHGPVPVGGAIQNLAFYVLDGEMRPVPVGLPGELYIGGAGVARGYLGRPALSAEKFVPDPFAGAGTRMYRTGDRARWQGDGNLLILGRTDNQVKIRGYRVELGEIEAVIRRFEGVRDGLVVVREDVPGDRRLVAYVAGDADAAELREHLRRALPEYMVPAAFVWMDALPQTATGKIDPRTLPAPDYAPAAERYVAPRTPAEEVLAEVWAQVLGVERVGTADNFFELGGHSLLVIRVVSRVRELFSVELPLRAIFEAPTVAALANAIETLRRAGEPVLPPVVPVGRDRPLPLSFAQERLWFLDRMDPGNAAYNVFAPLRLHGALDAAALERALGEIVRRHEALRTVFRDEGGSPVQVIADFGGFALPMEDLSRLDGAERDAAVRRRAREEAVRPFDLAAGPLFRATLLRLADEDHALLLALHHVVSDGWSFGILLRELAALYAAFAEGRAPELPELPVQYADFAVWQRAQLQGEVLERQLAYWTRRLADAPALLALPTDRPRPAVQGFGGAYVPVSIRPALLERLRALGRGEGATLHMVVLAAFQVLLAKHGAGDDVVVGTPIAGRGRGEVEPLIGFFVNTLPLRTDLSGDPEFREVLRRVRETTLGAYEHQDLPFERLVAELQPERSLSHTPLFQATFVLEDEALEIDLPGVAVGGVEVDPGIAQFDLALGVRATADGLDGRVVYRTDLFESATIERMLVRFQRLLEQAAADPGLRLSRIALLDEAERRALVEERNRTARPYPRGVCIHDRFHAQVRARPDAEALAWGETRLTYAELDARANRLAHHLVRRGVGPESRVGVLLERGIDLVVSLLAVLKAGGCYVPLDPAYPAERLALMTADAGASVLVTKGGLASGLQLPGVAVVELDAAEDAVAAEPADAPRSGASPENLAYIVYTSGSTGRPKGVMVAHRHVVQLVCETDYVRLAPGDRVAQASNASFDALTFEAWGALMNGATLVGIGRDVLLSPSALRRFLRDERITTLYQTTALLNQLTREHPDIFAPLREVLFGGQASDADRVRALLAGGKPQRLLHMYGPTETTAWCSWHDVTHVPADALTVSVGRPTGNQRIYLLDGSLNPVPAGVPGEAWVGGDGVVRGYLDRPALTAERFVPDPFAAEPGARMYRTGDRLRWTEAREREGATVRTRDGEDAAGRETASAPALPHAGAFALEFVGRVDEQVKIRGFRIEPGEIESVLSAREDVREARVIVREDEPGERRLVAYVVGPADPASLREQLKRSLPEYMVPAAFVSVDRLPLTPNGKLDVRALPAPGPSAEDRWVAPRTPAEEVLAGVWAQVLGAERVGAADSFFELGGHSLLAMRVVSRVRALFSVELPLRAIFEGPTVARLAEAIEALRHAGRPMLPPVVPVERTGPLPLSFAQERLWFLDRMGPGNATYNVTLPLRLQGALNRSALERALGEIVRRHEALRTVFRDVGGSPVQVIAPFAGFTVSMDDLSHLDEAERGDAVERRVREESARPFDLAAGPLFRATLLRLDTESHALLLALHHVVSDGWSLGVLLRELTALYGAFAEGRESPLPELPVQYADYAVWQRGQLGGELLERQLAYWRERLAGAPALLELPTDHPRPAVQGFGGAYAPVDIPMALLERLRGLGRGEGATLFMVVLAAFQVLLAKHGAGDDVVVGTPIAGRVRGEVEPLIGFFVNALALRTDLSGDPDFREVLRRVRDVTLGAYEHQDLPFERLVAELQPERTLSHTPLFQATLTLEDEGPDLGLPGLAVTEIEIDAGTAKLDLALALRATSAGLIGGLVYRTDLFERATVDRMLARLVRVLEQAAADPGVRLSGIGLLDEAERRRVLQEWSPAAADVPTGCIHHLFAAQAARTPDAAAIASGGLEMSYRALDEAANRLAHHLAARGVESEARVGVIADRTPQGVVALLAVLKAGGAYVPLDPAYPADRLAYMLADAGVRLVIAPGALPAALEGASADVVDLRAEADAIAARPGSRAPDVFSDPDHLAYIVYTSGSTGRPKGVAVAHRGVRPLVEWKQARLGQTADDRALQFASLSFDAAVEEVFGALLIGGTLVMAPREALLPGAPLIDTLRRERVTFATLPPAALAVLDPADAPTLRVVVSAGEALPPAVAARWAGAVQLHNAYGPTETTVCASSARVEPGDGRAPAIGRPLESARARVLDAAGRPVPAGVPGELYLGGAGVARGYHGRPALTAERFVPDAFSPVPGARLYRTGDRARWREVGEDDPSRTAVLEFLGRLDGQVKIRGFRIETGEIEAALRAGPGVADCAVVVREDTPGDPRLVAYVVGGAGADEVRAHLKGSLPEYMVPAAFVGIERLPLTPNGKLDRRALPAPSSAQGPRAVEPGAGLEARIAAIWADLLELEAVGAEDNFFDLGGHSLLLVQLHGTLTRELGCEVPLMDLFHYPTVRSLARALQGAAQKGAAEKGEERGGVRQAARARLAPRRPRP